MRRIILTASILFYLSSLLHAQIEIISVAYQSTENNTYKYEYYDDGDGDLCVEVFNIHDPFEGNSGVELNTFLKVKGPVKSFADIVENALDPYYKIRTDPELDFFVSVKIGLDGKVGHVSFIHLKSVSFPVEAYEAVEKALKDEYILTLQYDPNNIEGVYTVYQAGLILFEKEETTRPPLPPLTPEPLDPKPELPPGVTNPREGEKP